MGNEQSSDGQRDLSEGQRTVVRTRRTVVQRAKDICPKATDEYGQPLSDNKFRCRIIADNLRIISS